MAPKPLSVDIIKQMAKEMKMPDTDSQKETVNELTTLNASELRAVDGGAGRTNNIKQLSIALHDYRIYAD